MTESVELLSQDVKPKTSPNTKFSCSKISIGYTKIPIIDLKHLEESSQSQPCIEDTENEYNPFSVKNIQQYQPLYSLFFDMTRNNYNSIQFNHQFQIKNMTTLIDTVTNSDVNKQVFIKYSPLYDPIKYMIGKYHEGHDGNICIQLPNKFSDDIKHSVEVTDKLESIHNASYVDGFFCFLSSKLLHTFGFKHAMDYYGSYLGIQEQFKMNIVDDYEYLISSTFFNNHLNKLFKTTNPDFIHSLLNVNSRANRNKLEMSGEPDDLILDVQELTVPDYTEEMVETTSSELEDIYKHSKPDTGHISDDSSDSDNNYSTDEENTQSDLCLDSDGSESCCSEEEDDESVDSNEPENIYAYIRDFPVQMICLEKCEGTLDELFESGKMDEKRSASALFQIVMTLIAYQKVFRFTHNDLHTNNIMYVNTVKEYLYYKHQNIKYKVPTYGKIFKIIDFGRSIYHFQGHRFCSDSFGPGGDAVTQYNTEPYFDEKKPRIEPNDSFDLCRLGTSIFDFVFDIDDPNHDKKMNPLQATILRWCSDDSGKNVLYKRNGEERYPSFKLYKMIARNVHNHTPQSQLDFPFFKQFRFMGKPLKQSKDIINIDLLY